MFLKRLKPYFQLGIYYLIISFLLRIVFIFHPITTTTFSFFESIKLFVIGAINDIFIFVLASSIFVLYTLFLSEAKYKKPWGQIILALLVLAIIYVQLIPGNIFKQYGGGIVQVVVIFLGIKTFFFALMLFLPKKHLQIRRVLYFIALFLYVLLITFNAVSEYFFWNEFGVRYNFIAVDYLIYTGEVIGNIMESYPIVPLFTGIGILSLLVTWFIYKKTKINLLKLPDFPAKMGMLGLYILLAVVSFFLIKPVESIHARDNFAEEIQANGLYKFNYAFQHNELNYHKFYKTIPEKEAQQLALAHYVPPTFVRAVTNSAPEEHKNVVLISVESLSADFLAHYGNTEKITPFLDSLADKSLMFTNFYAAGNRTVRGLEALTLNIPPTAGESIIKRKDNANKFTTGTVFKEKGYQVKFLYGGYSYFDNMKSFFEGNGYGIVDRSNFTPDEITFANVWGVADEDMAKKAIQVMNQEYKNGKPFFNHWMTVSNHRPFTYPEGKIDISGKAKSRQGGVKYTDYALHQFFKMASKQPWYKNTVFVIVADHCASSAGKTDLPMDKYRIPAIVYSPDGFIKPGKFTEVMSQIDLMPTVFGLLHFNYKTKFLGQDVFKPNYSPRAFIATYQDLGFVKDHTLTILSPGKKVLQYDLKQKPSKLPAEFNIYYHEIPVKKINQNILNQAIGIYQSTSHWIKTDAINNFLPLKPKSE